MWNGYLAGRQPFDGQGYAEVTLPGQDDPLPTQSQVHGLFALGRRRRLPGSRAAQGGAARGTADWSTLSYDDGSGIYKLSKGDVANYRQALDLKTGTLTTR